MTPLRLCEWSRVQVDKRDWPSHRREALAEAVLAWKDTHRLNALPLEWSGSDGCTLTSKQWVGVVEIEGARVEIYPKTDKRLLANPDHVSDEEAKSTLSVLLRLLEASGYGNWVETDRASLHVDDLTFIDVWAFLLAKNLWPQLRRGLPAAYLPQEDDLPVVRGRILLGRQLARFGERVDRVHCAWDEFSPDTPLLRLLKRACRFLRSRATHPAALGLLGDCLFLLDEVQDISSEAALRATDRLVWTRGTERFRPSATLSRHILRDSGPQLGSGSEDTWVFLVDMNKVFEGFCQAALEDSLGISMVTQSSVGHLLRQPNKLEQLPDYAWNSSHSTWLGDAKWKLLGDSPDGKIRPKIDDIRQLTTYAELALPAGQTPSRAKLAIFYPSLANGPVTEFQTWNHTTLSLVPVNIVTWKSPKDALATFASYLSTRQSP